MRKIVESKGFIFPGTCHVTVRGMAKMIRSIYLCTLLQQLVLKAEVCEAVNGSRRSPTSNANL